MGLRPAVEASLQEFENTKCDLDQSLEELERAICNFEETISRLRVNTHEVIKPDTTHSGDLVKRLVPAFDDNCMRFREEVTDYRSYITEQVLSLKQTDWSMEEMLETIENIRAQIIKVKHYTDLVLAIDEELPNLA